MAVLDVKFNEATKDYGLRLDPRFHNFAKRELPDTLKTFKFPVIKFGKFIYRITNGKDVSKDKYSIGETNYVYLTVNNIKKYEIVFNEIIFLNDETGLRLEKNKLQKDDLIITRSGTVGVCKLFDLDDGKVYIPSGYLIIVKLREGLDRKFVEYYLSHNFIGKYFQIHATGKTQQNISQVYIKRIPIPQVLPDIQKITFNKIEEIENKINGEKQKIVPLQDVIERVFIKYGVKSSKFKKKEFEAFTTDASKIADQKFLRCGAQYRAFWDVHNGLLFDGKSKFPVVKLGSVMKLHKTKTLKKGILDKEYILLDLEDLEQFTGKVLNTDKLVSEIGSDKTLFEDAEIIVSKIDPYLGYTFLNDQSKPLIGSTELLPYKVNKKLALPEYIKHLLLSHEYILKSNLLMYGKRHPRLHPLDLLNIRVPLPDLEIQKEIVNGIKEKEKINDTAQGKIETLREEIDEIIWATLTEGE